MYLQEARTRNKCVNGTMFEEWRARQAGRKFFNMIGHSNTYAGLEMLLLQTIRMIAMGFAWKSKLVHLLMNEYKTLYLY